MKFLIALLFVVSAFAQQKKVYIAYIDGEIDLGLAPYVTRVINEAEENNADAIIFKVNTFGGRVDAATQIKDAILSSKVLTIAYVNNRAISAGALITLSCNKIVMVPGSSIGAATVVDETGQKQSEKYQSYMRSEMRSTAERNGRRTDIAEGMVDERITVEGLDDSTKLITLTSEEAFKYKIADTVITDFANLLSAFNLKNAEEVSISSNWAEAVVRFLNNPIVSSILIMIGFFGLMAEIKSPGWGVAGTAALISLTLFFGSSYILQLASILEILLFVFGLGLLLAEIFIIPGFGITGISGIILIFASIFLAMLGSKPFIDMEVVSIAIMQIAGAMLFALVGMFFLVKYLPKSTAFNKLVLSESEHAEKGFVSYPSDKNLVNKEGIAFTTLRPGGTAEIEGRRIDVVADSEFIQQGKRIKVLRVEGIKVVVTSVKDNIN